MSSEGYHEAVEVLSEPAKDTHRAIVSLKEELEAVDWYAQRAEGDLQRRAARDLAPQSSRRNRARDDGARVAASH